MSGPLKSSASLGLFLFALMLLIPVAEAAVPQQIALAGMRTNASGGAEKGFTHLNINFTLFDSTMGGRIIDTRLINITTNNNGFWFVNYSTTSFDTDVDLWLAINNTAPRIFISPPPYSSQFIKKNESNIINSTLTLGSGARISGLLGSLVNSSGLNGTAITYGTVPQGALDSARTWTTVQTFSAANVFATGQSFGATNFTGPVNITGVGVSGQEALSIEATGGSKIFIVNALERSFRFFMNEMNITILAQNLTGLALRRTDGSPLLQFNTFGGSLLTLTGTLNITNLTAGIAPNPTLLINSTGGINASAVGFGLIPQGVLDAARTWTTVQTFTAANIFSGSNVFTAGQRFSNLNVSGDVNITSAAESARTFTVHDATGIRAFAIDTSAGIIHSAYILNISANSNVNSFAVRNAIRNIFRVDTTTGGTIHTEGTLNITNITHTSGGLMINSTGSINASAIYGGRIADDVLNQSIIINQSAYFNGSAAPIRDSFIQFGYGKTDGSAPTSKAQVTLNKPFTSNSTYSVVVIVGETFTIPPALEWVTGKINGSTFNVSTQTTNLAFDWIAIGY